MENLFTHFLFGATGFLGSIGFRELRSNQIIKNTSSFFKENRNKERKKLLSVNRMDRKNKDPELLSIQFLLESIVEVENTSKNASSKIEWLRIRAPLLIGISSLLIGLGEIYLGKYEESITAFAFGVPHIYEAARNIKSKRENLN